MQAGHQILGDGEELVTRAIELLRARKNEISDEKKVERVGKGGGD